MGKLDPKGEDNYTEEFPFTLPPRSCLCFFLYSQDPRYNEKTAYAEMALLWDVGVNGKKLC